MDNAKRTMGVSPYDKANILSKFLFLWTVNFFKQGSATDLDIDTLPGPRADDGSDKLGDTLEMYWNKEVCRCAEKIKANNITDPKKMPKPSLFRALCKSFAWDIIELGLLLLVAEAGLKLATPIMLGRLLEYFSPNTTTTREDALLSAGLIVALSFVSIFVLNHYVINSYHLGMRARVAVCSLIYRKALKLSRTALGDSTPGKVVNLLSNDVNRFDLACFFMHHLWVAPVTAFIVLWLLLDQVGVAGLMGIAVVFIVMPLQGYTGKLSAKFRFQTAVRTDERVRLMDEIISGVQVIKMYAWEKPFAKLIALARRSEINIVRKNSYVRALFMTFLLFTTRCAIFFTMAFMALRGDTLTASVVFVFAQYFSNLSLTMSGNFVRAISEAAEGWVSVRRLQAFLLQDEFVVRPPALAARGKVDGGDERNGIDNSHAGSPESRFALKISKGSARWLWDSEDWTLKDIDVELEKGNMIGVIGPVGSGKSSLLQAILGELNLERGYVVTNGRISYASQEPWIFGSSVRQNILFGLPYDKFRYKEVVRVCALQKDFQQFSHGDQTLVGDRGASLSGGQKARINLARAVYRQADLYIMDDPLSAVDAHVGKHLYEKCIHGYLRNATRILVTHQLHYLQDADYIIMMKDGMIEMQGTYHDIATSSLDYARQLIAPSADRQEPESVESEIRDGLRNRGSRSRQNSVVSSQSHMFDECDARPLLPTAQATPPSARSMPPLTASANSLFIDLAVNKEEDDEQQRVVEGSSKDAIMGSVGVHYANVGGSKLGLAFAVVLFLVTQSLASFFDFFVSYWVAQEEQRTFYHNLNETSSNVRMTAVNMTAVNVTEQAWKDTANKFKVTLPAYIQPYETLLSTNVCLAILGTSVLLILVVALFRAAFFYHRCMTASNKLHRDMFKAIVRSPMKFFDDNPSGRIINRFAKDIGAIDELLPKACLDAFQLLLIILGSLVLTAMVNPAVLVVLAFLAIILFLIRRIYLKTSKNLKRLEGIYRSPVFTHLGATMQGLPTIRVCKAQDIVKSEFDSLQDVHSSTSYAFLSTTVAVTFCLDFLCLLFTACVTFSFFNMGSDLLGDKVGLAITQAMSLTFLMQYGVRQSAEVANQLMAVERVLEYTNLEPEPAVRDEDDKLKAAKLGIQLPTFKKPPRGWPDRGRVEFRDVRMRYGLTEKDPYVIKNLSCVIRGREKVGIVGRTGAGKSSLIQALFRLAYVENDIIIDGVNTADITLEDLRSQLSIIPQDPMLFSSTLRRNLDPFEEYSDDALWQALDQVELKESLGNPAGLKMRVMDRGSNFSVGQRQLVCLARALLRNNRILMMDEATANVDPYTDELIQMTIRTKFADCTVLTIAHRLNTIMDYDKVLVMDHGTMVEFAHPHELMEMRGSNPNEDGYFRKMVLETGADNARKLADIARNCYEKSKTLAAL